MNDLLLLELLTCCSAQHGCKEWWPTARTWHVVLRHRVFFFLNACFVALLVSRYAPKQTSGTETTFQPSSICWFKTLAHVSVNGCCCGFFFLCSKLFSAIKSGNEKKKGIIMQKNKTSIRIKVGQSVVWDISADVLSAEPSVTRFWWSYSTSSAINSPSVCLANAFLPLKSLCVSTSASGSTIIGHFTSFSSWLHRASGLARATAGGFRCSDVSILMCFCGRFIAPRQGLGLHRRDRMLDLELLFLVLMLLWEPLPSVHIPSPLCRRSSGAVMLSFCSPEVALISPELL